MDLRTYGRDRAALCATVARYRSRGAVREVGKVLGLTEDVTAALAGQVWGWSSDGVDEEHAAALNLNLSDRRLRMTLEIARELIGFPRHMSQHPGGFVLTQDRLDTLVPIEPAAMDEPPGDRVGQGRYRHLQVHEGGCAGPGHARLHAPRLRPARRASRQTLTTSPTSRRTTRATYG